MQTYVNLVVAGYFTQINFLFGLPNLTFVLQTVTLILSLW